MDTSRPRLIVVAGPNGAGKTSITEAVLRHQWMQGCEYINPDNIARDQFGDWNSLDTVLKAANLAAERRESCLRQGADLAFDTVLSSPGKVDLYCELRRPNFSYDSFSSARGTPPSTQRASLAG